MYAIAVFHHSVVLQHESKLIKCGCTLLDAGAGGPWGNKGQRDGESAKVRAAEQAQLFSCQEKVKVKPRRMRLQNQTSVGFHSCIERILSQYKYKLLQAYAPSKLHFPVTFNLIRYNDFFPLRSSVDYRSHF